MQYGKDIFFHLESIIRRWSQMQLFLLVIFHTFLKSPDETETEQNCFYQCQKKNFQPHKYTFWKLIKLCLHLNSNSKSFSYMNQSTCT